MFGSELLPGFEQVGLSGVKTHGADLDFNMIRGGPVAVFLVLGELLPRLERWFGAQIRSVLCPVFGKSGIYLRLIAVIPGLMDLRSQCIEPVIQQVTGRGETG